MSTGIYIRISSHTQTSDSQRTEIQRWLDAHGYQPDSVHWFEDIESGVSMNRKRLDALHQAIFTGEIKTVVVWKLDRLARSMREGINTLSRWCEAGARVVSITQQLDLSGPVGRLVAGVLFGIAEIEREHIRERQTAGIAAAKQRGVYTGRKKGATKAPTGPEQAPALRARGLKNREIAAILKVTERTVGNYLNANRH